MDKRYPVSLTQGKKARGKWRRMATGAEDPGAADSEMTLDSLSLGADGELTGAMSCLYCGSLNHGSADVCSSCGEYIADQGPDLSARLHRIRRHAAHSRYEPRDGGLREAIFIVEFLLLLFLAVGLTLLLLFVRR